MILKKLRKYRRIFYTVGVIALVIILTSVRKKYRNTICGSVKITVLDSTEAKYLTQSTVLSYLIKNYDTAIEGNYFKNIDIRKIEHIINNNYYVKSAQVFRNGNDILEIKLTQRKPFIRVFDKENTSYYIDNIGNLLPISKNYASYVSIYSGNITHFDSLFANGVVYNINDEMFDTTILPTVYKLAKKIEQNDFMLALTDQVYVLPNNEFEIIPKLGSYKILLGTIDSCETKFQNLSAFYQQAAPKVGWDKYSIINLKYLNQVICTKK